VDGVMRIEAVDVFYLSMPEVLDIGDGSQDACLVRVRAGGHEGWGECEAAPLPTIAAMVCPMSHSACKNVLSSVVGQRLERVDDIARIGEAVRANSLDLLQADHALSGIDIALWDLLGRREGVPVYALMGQRAHPKLPYASVLFGDTPGETLAKARAARAQGYRAAKFGWGPFGRAGAGADADQVMAAREGLGADATLLVDAGTVWGEDLDRARQRLSALTAARATWLEEPFVGGALKSYRALAAESGDLRLAGGEGCHTYHQAEQMIDAAGIGFVQIDTGRIGGISPARRVATYAAARGITYVNHTFTSHLALSASLQPYIGDERSRICEYPAEPKALARDLTRERLEIDADGELRLPNRAGLGVTVDRGTVARYLVDAEIRVGSTILYRTPSLA
jgi:L-alanine-DL-glutamate epimerase-like enolase superfamily enzyme